MRIDNGIFSALLVAFGLLLGQPAAAEETPATGFAGDCGKTKFFEIFGFTNKNADGRTVFVARHEAPAFKEPVGGTPARTVPFSTGLAVVEVDPKGDSPNGRVGVMFPREGAALYWMDRADLLCNLSPMRDATTLIERKALIRTKTVQRQNEIQSITAFREPSATRFAADDRHLTRLATYLIYGESPQAYLVADKFTLASESDRLVGWIKKDEAINWNWAIGLRPPHDIKNSDGSTGQICGHEERDFSGACIPILGGLSWFTSALRLPVLEVTPDAYRVVVSTSGLGGAEIVDGKIKLTKAMLDKLKVDPAQTPGINEEGIRAFNKVDVFFLIDGTKSMAPYIDAVRGTGSQPGVVQNILTAIGTRSKDVSVRAGFRIYRDSDAKGNDGIGEGVALSDSRCDANTEEARARDRRRFDERLATVGVTTDDQDDYEENLLGGLEKAAYDIRGCADRQKLLFVIGDAGYNPFAQAERKRTPLTHDQVYEALSGIDKLTVFFIRPPHADTSASSNPGAYDTAWKTFRTDAMEILRQVAQRANAGATDAVRVDPERYFIDLASGGRATRDMLERITASVKEVANPGIINDVLIDLRGGAPIEKIIERLRNENNDVPVLFWNMLRRTACADSPETCKQAIYEGVFEVYVKRNQPHVLEAWLLADQLARWASLTKPIVDSADTSLPEQRRAFGNLVQQSLQSTLRMPSPENLNQQIGEFVQRAGRLPGPIKTPLMNYTFKQLEEAGSMPTCEVDRLRNWLRNSSYMLERVLNSDRLSNRREEKAPGECPGMTEAGAKIPWIRTPIDVLVQWPDDKKYSLSKDAGIGERVYWVPHDYLP